MNKKNPEKIFPSLAWNSIDTVLLDMDGTLLDKHFDDYFWNQYLPEHYSLVHDISIDQARSKLFTRYKKVENTLNWTDIDYWSKELKLDIPELKMRVDHLISVHPYVIEFLEFCLIKRKKLYLVTNAHSKTLAIKLRKTLLGSWFDRITCSEEIGFAKEQPEFWQKLELELDFDKNRTILADDTEKVLRAAESSGMERDKLIFVAKPSSKLEVAYSSRYPSIDYFKELITG